MQKIVCRKCGNANLYAKGLCRSCYNQFYYANMRHNTTLKNFVTQKQETHYNRELKCYDEFKKLYEQEPRVRISTIAKILSVSRQTIYTYKELYEKTKK